jgi:hypothetical protein
MLFPLKINLPNSLKFRLRRKNQLFCGVRASENIELEKKSFIVERNIGFLNQVFNRNSAIGLLWSFRFITKYKIWT